MNRGGGSFGGDDALKNIKEVSRSVSRRGDGGFDTENSDATITEIPGYESTVARDVAQFTYKRSLYVNKNYDCPCKGIEPENISFTNTTFLKNFTSERGKILSSRVTFVCAKHQRMLKREIKKARVLSLLPYIAS